MNNKINSSPEENQETPQEYFKSVLGENSTDYLDLERMVTETNSKISWENLKKFTKIENGKVEGIYWEGDLDLKGTNITSLGKLKKVSGELDLEGVSTLTDLGVLEEVLLNLDLRGTNITSLGRLKKVDRSLYLERASNLTDLGVLEVVGGSLDLNWTNISSLGKLKKVDGYLGLEGVSTLTDLGDLEVVGGNLDLTQTSITSLGKLKKVGWFLKLTGLSTLTDLGELSEVLGNLYLTGTSLSIQLEVFKKIRENNLIVWKSIHYDECLFSSKILELFNSQMIYGKPISFKYQDKESFKSIFGKEENRDEKLQNVCLEIAKEVINVYLESLEAKKLEYKENYKKDLKKEILKDYTEKRLFFEEMFGVRITGEIFSQFLKK